MDEDVCLRHSADVLPMLEGYLDILPPLPTRCVRVFLSSTFSGDLIYNQGLQQRTEPFLPQWLYLPCARTVRMQSQSHKVLLSVRRTERLGAKITIVSSPNWVERIRIY